MKTLLITMFSLQANFVSYALLASFVIVVLSGSCLNVHNVSSLAVRADSKRLLLQSEKTTIVGNFGAKQPRYFERQVALITGLSCTDDFCDVRRGFMTHYAESESSEFFSHWTGRTLDGEPSEVSCPPSTIATGAHCNGSHCEMLRLKCGRLDERYWLNASDIRTSTWSFRRKQEHLCPDGYYIWGIACRGRYCDEVKLNCALVEHQTTAETSKDFVKDAAAFAPVYLFDGKGPAHCLPDWPSLDNDNVCRTSFMSETPVFVEYDICDELEVYTFWLWYGDQKSCGPFDPGHGNDWEHVSVFVKDKLVEKVIFYQHNGWYTRKRGTYTNTGEHPHVYIGKVAHGSYHENCNGVCSLSELFTKLCFGSVKLCIGGCGYWEDFRGPGPILDTYKIFDLQPGKTIDGISRPDREVCRPSCSGTIFRTPFTSGCWQNSI